MFEFTPSTETDSKRRQVLRVLVQKHNGNREAVQRGLDVWWADGSAAVAPEAGGAWQTARRRKKVPKSEIFQD